MNLGGFDHVILEFDSQGASMLSSRECPELRTGIVREARFPDGIGLEFHDVVTNRETLSSYLEHHRLQTEWSELCQEDRDYFANALVAFHAAKVALESLPVHLRESAQDDYGTRSPKTLHQHARAIMSAVAAVSTPDRFRQCDSYS